MTLNNSKLILSHGTSLFNLVYSLSEGGKPATSLALNKIDNNKNNTDQILKKFGDIVVTFDPNILIERELPIYTRDAYTMDSPSRKIYDIDKTESHKLSEKLKPFSEHTKWDISKILRDNSHTGEIMSFLTVVEKLAGDVAFQLSYLKEQGVLVDIPLESDGEPSPLSKYIATSFGNDLGNIKSVLDNADNHKHKLIELYDAYYKDLGEKAKFRFHLNISKACLAKPDEIRFESAVKDLEEWQLITETSPMRVNKSELKQIVSSEIDKLGTARLFEYAIAVATKLTNIGYYSCYDEEFDSKEDAWDYIHNNSFAQSQQSMTYSINEIFSLKANRIDASDIYKHLEILRPEFFVAGLDEPNSDLEQLNRFKGARESLESAFDFEYEVLQQTKFKLIDDVVTGKLTAHEAIKERNNSLSFGRHCEDSVVTDLAQQVCKQYKELSTESLRQIAFEDSYEYIRCLKKDLDTLLAIRELTFSEGRDFSKELFSSLVSSKCGDARDFCPDAAVTLRRTYGKDQEVGKNIYAIATTMSELGEAFDKLPDHSPYFEVILDKVLQLNDETIQSIYFPEESRIDAEYLIDQYPFLKEKIHYYNSLDNNSLFNAINCSKEFVTPVHFQRSEELTKKASCRFD